MNQIKLLFKKRMFLILLFILVFYIITLPSGFNKSIGFTWFGELPFYIKLYYIFILGFYLMNYSLLALIKKETNVIISILHTILLIITTIILNKNIDDLILITNFVSLIFFSINVIYSLKFNKTK